MKRRIFEALISWACVCGPLSAQQSQVPVSVSLSGGPSTGAFRADFAPMRGGHAELALSFAPDAWPVVIRGEFGLQRFSADDRRLPCPVVFDPLADLAALPSCGQFGIREEALSGTLSIMLPKQLGRVSTYVIGGIGTYSLAERVRWAGRTGAQCGCDTGIQQFDRSWTRLGYNGGGGAAIPLGKIWLFAEARYHYVPGDVRAYMVPISFGIRR